jgi:hypothetical protein
MNEICLFYVRSYTVLDTVKDYGARYPSGFSAVHEIGGL